MVFMQDFSGCSAASTCPSDSAKMTLACDICLVGRKQRLFLDVVLESLLGTFFALLGQEVGSSDLEDVWK